MTYIFKIDRDKQKSLKEFIDKVAQSISKDEPNVLEYRNLNRLEGLCYELSKSGWYLDDWKKIDSKILSKIQSLIYGNVKDRIDDLLLPYYQDNVIEIFDRLKTHYPSRKHIFNEANLLLQESRYHGFITLALSLVDGMCIELLGKEYFKTLGKKGNHKLELSEDLDKIRQLGYYFLLKPITEKSAISDFKDAMSKYNDPLNRHEILHGKNVSYGTKINAIKILSFMAFTDYILHLE
ncbi:hypothetical protein C9994_00015 [Marivirga lumbricoides]|uniref:Uncharacterized protein n=1 Tax=Marivirga lumbricoides TaxID=1046115 RepID=A0A2T4DVW4_9BACT|nr:hypothetical protein C9994_00015 [Marivirga lumbricoides]